MKIERGFTLLELLVTLAVAGVLFSIAIPNFRTTVQDSRLITETNSMVGMFALARSKAITLGGSTVVGVCPGTVATNNTVTCTSGGSSGWEFVVFSASYASSGCFTGTKTAIRVYPAPPSTVSINVNPSTTSVSYLASGLLCSPTVATNFYFCDSRGYTEARTVSLTLTGSAKASTTAGEDGTGTALTSTACP
jgi:type IV fimbrial biogenesis protein FimT